MTAPSSRCEELGCRRPAVATCSVRRVAASFCEEHLAAHERWCRRDLERPGVNVEPATPPAREVRA